MIGRRALATARGGAGAKGREQNKKRWRLDVAANSESGSSPERDRRRSSERDRRRSSERDRRRSPERDRRREGRSRSPDAARSDKAKQKGRRDDKSPSESSAKKQKKEKAFAWMDSDDDEDEEGGAEDADGPPKESEKDREGSSGGGGGGPDQANDEESRRSRLERLPQVQTLSEFLRLAPQLARDVQSMGAADFVSLCQAASRVKFFDGELFEEVFRHLLPKIQQSQLTPSQVADILGCLTELNACDAGMLAAASASMIPRIGELDKAQRLRLLDLLGDSKSPHAARLVNALRSAPVPEDVPLMAASNGRLACKHFARGFCVHGKKCTFAHEAGLVVPPTTNPQVPTHMQELESMWEKGTINRAPTVPPCRHFQSGYCSRGSACTYRHDEHNTGSSSYRAPVAPRQAPPRPAPPRAAAPRATMPARTQAKPCLQFASGTCTRGSRCHFLHLVPGQAGGLF